MGPWSLLEVASMVREQALSPLFHASRALLEPFLGRCHPHPLTATKSSAINSAHVTARSVMPAGSGMDTDGDSVVIA